MIISILHSAGINEKSILAHWGGAGFNCNFIFQRKIFICHRYLLSHVYHADAIYLTSNAFHLIGLAAEGGFCSRRPLTSIVLNFFNRNGLYTNYIHRPLYCLDRHQTRYELFQIGKTINMASADFTCLSYLNLNDIRLCRGCIGNEREREGVFLHVYYDYIINYF